MEGWWVNLGQSLSLTLKNCCEESNVWWFWSLSEKMSGYKLNDNIVLKTGMVCKNLGAPGVQTTVKFKFNPPQVIIFKDSFSWQMSCLWFYFYYICTDILQLCFHNNSSFFLCLQGFFYITISMAWSFPKNKSIYFKSVKKSIPVLKVWYLKILLRIQSDRTALAEPIGDM